MHIGRTLISFAPQVMSRVEASNESLTQLSRTLYTGLGTVPTLAVRRNRKIALCIHVITILK